MYIENICLIIHIVPFYGYKFLKYGCTRELKFIYYLLLKSCPGSIFWNLEFVLDQFFEKKKEKKVVLDRFFENLEFIQDDSISHY